jgi:hypothetical protein
MPLSLDERTVRTQSCVSCRESVQQVTGFINDEGGAVAAYFAACHPHPEHEAQIDVVLGTWGVDPPADDHLPFSCRLQAGTIFPAPRFIAGWRRRG